MEAIQFVQTTPEQLYTGIKEIVKHQIEELKKDFQPKEPEELLTREQTSNLLKIDKSTLWLWTKKGKLNAYGIGNRVYYKRSEIEKAIVELKYKKVMRATVNQPIKLTYKAENLGKYKGTTHYKFQKRV